MNRLAQSVYSMMQAENSQNALQLTASEQAVIVELAEFRREMSANAWAMMGDTWYPVVDGISAGAEREE